MLRRSTSGAALLAALAVAAPAGAQSVIEVEEISASASLEDVAVAETGVNVTVLDRDDIEVLGETRVSDVLQRVAGVTIRSNGPIGTNTGVVIRGASQNYIAVYVDGIEVSDPSGPQVAYDFAGLTAGDIGRIEILKGSQSALYGSRAIGGVISITTRRAVDLGQSYGIDVEYGSNDSFSATVSAATKTERGEAAVTLSHVETDGFSAADENNGNDEDDGFEKTRLSFYGHLDLDSGARIGASGFWEESEAEFDESFPAIADGAAPFEERTDNRSVGLRLFGEFQTGALDNLLEFSRFDTERESDGDFGPSNFEGERLKALYQGGVDIGADARLAFGADWTREEASDSFGFSGDNEVTGIFGEVTWEPSDVLDVTFALRHDEHSDFGGYTTGRVAVAWQAAPDLTFRSSVGTGFRAPSTYELFSSFGDPDLEPEESLSADLGVEKRYANGASVQATLFYLEVDNLIDFEAGSYTQIEGTSERQGLELAALYPLGERVDLSGSYTYTDSSSNASSAWAEVPRHAVSLTALARATDRLDVALNLRHASDRQDGLDDYTVADASVTYEVAPGTEAYLRIENLGDEEYQLVPGYGTSDRAVYVGLRTSF